MTWPVIGAMVNSALYLSAVFIAGIVENNSTVMHCAIAAIGFTYLSYLVQTRITSKYDAAWIGGNVLTGISIALGVAAGIVLLT
jgi:hypothetical protein